MDPGNSFLLHAPLHADLDHAMASKEELLEHVVQQTRMHVGEKGRETTFDGSHLHGRPFVVQLRTEVGASTLPSSSPVTAATPQSPQADMLAIFPSTKGPIRGPLSGRTFGEGQLRSGGGTPQFSAQCACTTLKPAQVIYHFRISDREPSDITNKV